MFSKKNEYLDFFFKITIIALLVVLIIFVVWLFVLGGWEWISDWLAVLVKTGR